MNLAKRTKNILVALILFAIVCSGFFIHLNLFSKTEYVNGTDGGFYAYKVREIVEEDKFDWNITSSPPMIFLTSAAFAKFFGVFNGVKMGTALFSALLGVSIFILTHYLTGSKKAALFAAFFAIISPMSLRIAADIRKNAAVLVFMPLIVYFYLKFAEVLSRQFGNSTEESRRKTPGVSPPTPGVEEAGKEPAGVFPWRNWIGRVFSQQSLKYAIPLGLAATLGLLSHSSIITIWFAFLAYLAFHLALQKRVALREFIPVFGANLILVILFILFYDKFSDKLEAIAAPPVSLNSPQFENLNTYTLPLALMAVPGAVSALFRKRQRDIFLLSWTLLLFLLTLSQTVGPKEYWRFLLIMFVPMTVLAGCGIAWALEKLGNAALIIPLVVAIIASQQFLAFGKSHFQMFPQLHEEILISLETAANRIPHNSYVYTNCPHHNYYWVRYFFGVNTARNPEQSIPDINELINQENDVYIARGAFEYEMGGMPPDEMEKPNGLEVKGTEISASLTPGVEGKTPGVSPAGSEETQKPDPFKDLETVYEDDYVTLLKVTSPINVLGSSCGEPRNPVRGKLRRTAVQTEVNPNKKDPDIRDPGIKDIGNGAPERRGYELSRLRYLSTYLILPYELINAINPPRIALWQIQLGLPLSVMLIGFAISLLLRLAPPRTVATQVTMIATGALIVLFIYGFSPSIFWGTPQMMGPNGDEAPPSMNGQENDAIKEENGTGYPCGDGICDEVEQANPNLCPKDCE